MPKQKDLKRIVRSRMQKTGESYTAARAQILRKKNASPHSVEPPPDYAALAGMSDAAVEKQTGRAWAQWVETLDALGAADKPHRKIAACLSSLGVPAWWSQMVAVGYERIRGLRAIGQRRSGSWEASKSRTFAVPMAVLFKAFSDARMRARWLPGVKLTVRAATPQKSIRLSWDDGTLVQVYFTPKEDGKSQVAVQHTKLPAKADADRMKEFWAGRLDALAEQLRRARQRR